MDCKEIQPSILKEISPGVSLEGMMPVLWPPWAKSWLIGKDSDAGRDWGQEEKGMTEDEMAGWHHWLDGHESEWTLGVGDGQGGLECCYSWGRKELDTTERLNWTELNWMKWYVHTKTYTWVFIAALFVAFWVWLLYLGFTQREFFFFLMSFIFYLSICFLAISLTWSIDVFEEHVFYPDYHLSRRCGRWDNGCCPQRAYGLAGMMGMDANIMGDTKKFRFQEEPKLIN